VTTGSSLARPCLERLRKFEILVVSEMCLHALTRVSKEGSRDTSLGVFPRSGEGGAKIFVRERDYEGVMNMESFIVESDIYETRV
jgi:hypothetical protein